MRRLLLAATVVLAATAQAQTHPVTDDLKWLTDTPAVSGYEAALSAKIADALKDLHPQRDSMGNVTITIGSGEPHRLIAAPIDEPGFVVSRIEQDGYLRVQRLPQTGMPPHYNEMHGAQPVTVTTRTGGSVPGVVAALSIHLTPGRVAPPDPDDLDNMYIDIGAKSVADVKASGVDILSPMATTRSLLRVGPHGFAGTASGDRYGAALLIELAKALNTKHGSGTTTIAFVAQQWAGSRGLIRVMQSTQPDELIYVGRGRPETAAAARRSGNVAAASAQVLTSGPIAYGSSGDTAWFAPGLRTAPAASFLIRGYGPAMTPPAHTLHVGIPTLYPLTAGEIVDDRDMASLFALLVHYAGGEGSAAPAPAYAATQYPSPAAKPSGKPDTTAVLRTLTESYGVSEQETMTREAVARLLPPWVKTETDSIGNLIVRFGTGKPQSVFMAHTDELGFRISAINADGSLELDNKGGGSPAFFWGHPALVHTATGMRGAVVALPDNFDTAQFKFSSDFRIAAKLNVGATSAQEVAEQGIKVGDFVTIPKHMNTLLNGRINIRSLDDRVGCTALVEAVWALGKDFHKPVTFVWSTREELGLLGAAKFAEDSVKSNQIPATIFAIDTFVSGDSPLEAHRFADGILGQGFLVRAIDSSNIVPWPDVQRVEALAKKHNIAMQYGVTGGGNDGATFTRYGTTDVALSWPLRYSHSPGEVIDIRDLNALSDIVASLANEW